MYLAKPMQEKNRYDESTHISIPYNASEMSKISPSNNENHSPEQKNKNNIGEKRHLHTISSMSSSSKTKKVANTLLINYGNCTTFKLCNENEQFFKTKNLDNEKDLNSLLMLNTPPSNSHKSQKFLLTGNNNNQNNPTIFSCTPKEECARTRKDDMKHTTMFQQSAASISTNTHHNRSVSIMHSPPYQNVLQRNSMQIVSPGLHNASCDSFKQH